ncbi:DUF6933 domain-containing protein [Kordia sp.]|uniref:DUF6933 domain-containing protein n=1 Tax=Kordia sp. TaxID=1965332 RepID=UPI003D2B31F5
MQTSIYTSKKLEKIISKLIKTSEIETSEGILGKWNVTLFYINRKKCFLFTNAKTAYNVILTDIKATDLNVIDDLFKDTLYAQLTYDTIITSFSDLDSIIGTINFYTTDNDKRTIGFQNHSIQIMNHWKHQFARIEKMHIKDLTNRMNTLPIHLGKGKKMSDYTTPVKEMKKLLS